MTRKTSFILLAVAIVAIVVIAYYLFQKPDETSPASSDAAVSAAVLPNVYEDADHGFSFSYGEDMTVRTMAMDDFDVVVVEGNDSVNGFQIIISPFFNDALLPADMGELLMGVSATEVKDLTVGHTGKGFIFRSDNPSFEGGSIEAWFAKGGRLYQATTYAMNEQMLLDSLATWKFR